LAQADATVKFVVQINVFVGRSVVESRKKLLVTSFLVGALWPAAVPMGETITSTSESPNYIELAEKEPILDGFVVDEKGTARERTTHLTKISFGAGAEKASKGAKGATTTMPDLKIRGEDSNNFVDLRDVKSLHVLSNEQPNDDRRARDFFEVNVINNVKGGETKLLFPLNTTICGIDKDTGIKKAWFLRNIDEVHITGEAPGTRPPAVIKTEKIAQSHKKVTKKG
jgi:hypothetical protein